MISGCNKASFLLGWRATLRHTRVLSTKASDRDLIHRLILNREWMLDDPSAKLTTVTLQEAPTFRVLRDDLSHPYISGNKRRKLDALWPELLHRGASDVVTCGGTQSAHTLAVAAAAAESGIRAHILFRGERPAVPSGNHLLARMLAHKIIYVPRSEYADRVGMLSRYAAALREADSEIMVEVVPEGGSEAAALLGMVRLVHWLAAENDGAVEKNWGEAVTTMVIDSGTGTSAIGLALGAALMHLPWTIVGVMLAGPVEYYQQQIVSLIDVFCRKEGLENAPDVAEKVKARLRWVERIQPRKFGKVLPGEILQCRQIASKHGIVVDPIWTLAAWEVAAGLAAQGEESTGEVVMIHTGGILGLFGLAQRFPEEF